MLTNYTFLNPIYFSIIIPILLLLLFLYFKKSKTNNFWPLEDLKKIYKSNSIYYKIYFILIFIISLLFISILANFVENVTDEKINKKGIDIEIVLDLSYSMKALDIKPNRLEAWKQVLIDFINTIKQDRIWVILFSWKPFNSIPLTFDYDFLKDFVWDLTVETIDQWYNHLRWTAIWDAIVLAIDSFKKSEDREKVIILITDGEANTWLDPILALKMAKKENIKIYTIWVWWTEPAYVEVLVWLFPQPQRVWVWPVDEKTLKKIATETWGKYFRATSKEKLDEIFKDISKLEKRDIEVDKITIHKDKNIILAYLIIFFMLLLFFIKYKKRI